MKKLLLILILALLLVGVASARQDSVYFPVSPNNTSCGGAWTVEQNTNITATVSNSEPHAAPYYKIGYYSDTSGLVVIYGSRGMSMNSITNISGATRYTWYSYYSSDNTTWSLVGATYLDVVNCTNYTPPTPAPTSNSTNYAANLIYTPHLCRMYFTDEWGNRLSGLTVTATPTGQTSVPNYWLNMILGIPVNASMDTSILSGTTSSDGSLSFLMVEVQQYTLTASGVSPINNATISQTLTFYPKDTDYTIKINTGLTTNLQSYPTYNLTDYLSTNETTINLTMNYTDTSGGTSNLTFYVRKNNLTMVSTQVIGGSGTAYYVINNTRGDSYTYGFNATNSLGHNGVIEGWKDVTPRGSGALFDFGLDSNTRMWISLAFIFLFAAMWGSTSVKAGAFLTPFLGAGLFWYIGWLPAGLGVTIFIMSFIGGLYYMRGQENKTVEA